MKYLIIISFGFFWQSSFGNVSFSDLTQRNYLIIYTLTVMCDLDQKLSHCDSLKMYKETKEKYDTAIETGADKKNELDRRMEELIVSEIQPYIETTCENPETAPSYLKALCELSEVIGVIEDSPPLPGEGNFYNPTFGKDHQMHAEHVPVFFQFQITKAMYWDMLHIAMEMACVKGQGIPAYCGLLNEIRAYEREQFMEVEFNLEEAEIELDYQIYLLCEREQDNMFTVRYINILCGNQR